MRVVCISDTHGQYRGLQIPDGDILVHSGDITAQGRPLELQDFNLWLGELPHTHKVVIAGNHDATLAVQSMAFAQNILSNAHYLQDSGVTVDGVSIWGSPWTPEFNDWYFMLPRGSAELRAKWAKIPEGTDILLTHGPPAGKCDYSKHQKWYIGCDYLREAVLKVRPTYHVFGHNHEGYGAQLGEFTTFINASIMTRSYIPINPPIEVEI
jgi:Icc-related predicted phosphoesterase